MSAVFTGCVLRADWNSVLQYTKGMKRYDHLYEKVYDIDNLRKAHRNAKKGKGWYKEVKILYQRYRISNIIVRLCLQIMAIHFSCHHEHTRNSYQSQSLSVYDINMSRFCLQFRYSTFSKSQYDNDSSHSESTFNHSNLKRSKRK